MKLSDVKDKMDSYFKKITPEELAYKFQELGIELEDIPK